MTFPNFTLPPLRVVGDPDPPGDMNNVVDALTAMGATYNVLDEAYGGGADPSGLTDSSAAVRDAAATGLDVHLPAGSYLFNSNIFPSLTTQGQRIFGDGPGITKIIIGASFSGAQLIFANAEDCAVENLTIAGASSTTTSNPAADAIYLNGNRHNCVNNVDFEYVNGWWINEVATGASAPYGSMFTNLSSYKNCAGGIHVQGVSGTNWAAQVFLSNINAQQIGVGSGAKANLDAFRFEDCADITAVNFNAAVSDASTGSTINIMGKCASHYFTNMDLGSFPNATSSANAVVQIQDTANGSPTDIRFVQGEAQQGLNGLLASGAAAKVSFTSFRFFNNYGSGSKLTGTGAHFKFTACTWDSNGQGGAANSGTYYDHEVTGTATGTNLAPTFLSPVVSVGTNGVQNVVALPSSGYAFPHLFATFAGSGTPATPFTHVPGVYVRADTSPPSWTGRLSVTSGQTANSGFQAVNTSSSPTVPFSQFLAKNAAEMAFGVGVSGDTVLRGIWDSNAKLSLGPGGTVSTDTDLYRSAAATLKTDGNMVVGGTLTALGFTFGAPATPAGVTPADPVGTSGTALVMMGLGTAGCVFTPASSGKLHVTVTGYGKTTTGATTFSVGARYGSGTAPSNGDPVTGTNFGAVNTSQTLRGQGIDLYAGFAFQAVLSLTPATSYWFDVPLSTGNPADAASLRDVAVTIIETS